MAYDEHSAGLNIRAFYKVQNLEVSEDIVQATFMKTWVYLVKGGKIDLMRAFLYHILNGLIIDEYRKRKPVSLDSLLVKGYELGSTEYERNNDIFDGKNALVFIQYLPPKYQKIIRMRYIDDLSLTEMSKITGQSKNTMAVQAHRGLAMLKTAYILNAKLKTV